MNKLFFFLILFISSEILSQTYQPENFLIEDPPNLYDQSETAIAIDPNDPDHIMVTPGTISGKGKLVQTLDMPFQQMEELIGQ